MQTFPWRVLLEWYKTHGRHTLPWRKYDLGDENTLLYRTWISEIFLQQTQVSRVINYFERVVTTFPTLQVLAKTNYETFFPYYQGLGYYSRARNILKTAKIIDETYDGVFPKEKKQLAKLPWVWPYTAHALLAFGYGEPYLAWDTNLEKVFSRYYKGRKDIKLTQEEKEEIEKDFQSFCIRHSEEWVSTRDEWRGNPGTKKTEHWIASSLAMTVRNINNALMDFSAMIDLKNPNQIDWENYPIREGVFYETHGSLEPIEEKKSVNFPVPDAPIIVILHKEHKIYYSNSQEAFQPFVLPAALHRDTRKYVQEYFREHYNLELSVRPVHKKWFDDEGKPFIEVNAQIQVWVPEFEIFEKNRGIFAKKSQEA